MDILLTDEERSLSNKDVILSMNSENNVGAWVMERSLNFWELESLKDLVLAKRLLEFNTRKENWWQAKQEKPNCQISINECQKNKKEG